jgi:hypothetical protein
MCLSGGFLCPKPASQQPHSMVIQMTIGRNYLNATKRPHNRCWKSVREHFLHFAQAKKTLDLFKRTSAKYLQEKHNQKTKIQRMNHAAEHSASAAIMANLSISLIEKLVSEMAISGNKHDASYICDPNYHNPFFNFWKETAKTHGDKVVSPRELANKLKSMVQQLPEFRTNIITYGIIMDVIIKKAHPRKAPMVADELLNFVRAEAKETRNKELQPTTTIYNQGTVQQLCHLRNTVLFDSHKILCVF